MIRETMKCAVNVELGRGHDYFMLGATLKVNGGAASYSYDNDVLLIGAGEFTIARDLHTGFQTGAELVSVSGGAAQAVSHPAHDKAHGGAALMGEFAHPAHLRHGRFVKPAGAGAGGE